MSTVATNVDNAANAAVNATANANTPTAAQKGLNGDYDQFLKLLTTELTNQDPTQPLDTNQITQQLASLSQVQQGINTNTKLDSLISLYNASQANTAVSYIGKQVDATGNQINLNGGTSALVYTLPTGAASATVTIKDSIGNTIFTGPAAATEGRNQVMWNGTNSSTGATAPDGTYNFTVDAIDAKGKALTATTYTTGIVTAVNTVAGVNSLALGQISVPLSSVQSIYTAGTNPGA